MLLLCFMIRFLAFREDLALFLIFFNFWGFSFNFHRFRWLYDFLLCFTDPLKLRINSFLSGGFFYCRFGDFILRLIIDEKDFFRVIFFQRICMILVHCKMLMFLDNCGVFLVFGAFFGRDCGFWGFFLWWIWFKGWMGLEFGFFRGHLVLWEESIDFEVELYVFDFDLGDLIKISSAYAVLNFILI